MYTRIGIVLGLVFAIAAGGLANEPATAGNERQESTTKVYVPYKELKAVFEKEGQGVFLPYKEFEMLWRAAQKAPAEALEAPFPYLVSTARFTGNVEEELARLKLELTIDVLTEEWVEIPVGLGGVAVSKASILQSDNKQALPLLRVANGQYMLVTKGKGRYVLSLDFVRQLDTQPGLAILKYKIPSAAITTLDLLIPEENLKVDVQPMLAATTSQAVVDDKPVTKLQAFLGAAQEVTLSWKPKTEAAAELEPVIICEQFQHIHVAEAIINYTVKLDYSIHRGGVDEFSIKLPSGFRVTEVGGANIVKWDIEAAAAGAATQTLKVKLFSVAKDKYSLTVKMERFLQEDKLTFGLLPVATEQVLRRSGLVGITSSPRRSVHLEQLQNLARVDTAQLPADVQKMNGATAYRFITSDYSASVAIETTSPRVSVTQNWIVGVDVDRLTLQGRLRYKVEKTGVFELKMKLPGPWEVESVEPVGLVDDFDLQGEGDERVLHILLKQEKIGGFDIVVKARTARSDPAEAVRFDLPLADAENLQLYEGQVLLLLANQLRAEVESLDQLQAIPLQATEQWAQVAGLGPAMGFEFRAVDHAAAAGASFKISVKPVQISATVHRNVVIEAGSVDQEAVVQYRIRYAPVDTFYLKMPAALADEGVEILGANIKEKPRIDELPADQQEEEADANDIEWAYYKVVLQSKVTGSYQVTVRSRKPFKAGQVGQASLVEVHPILAAGKLSDQNGFIAVSKADTLAIGEPTVKNLISGDASSATDLPWQPHRRNASLAFRYNSPPFALTLPVVTQKEAKVFTTIVNGVIVEQVLARDGMLNSHVTYLLATSQGDRLPITLPANVELTAVLLNGNEARVEMGVTADERIVRLPPSAGQVSRFVLEIAYGLKKVSPSKLVAPALPDEIPVQQTLWRLWLPNDYLVLHHNRVFSELSGSGGSNLVGQFGRGQPIQVGFKLAGQGRAMNFVRQGAPGMLSVRTATKQVFSIVIWLAILGAGAAMLKLDGWRRLLVVIAIAFLAGVVNLFAPLLAGKAVATGWYAVILVAMLWIGQWVLVKLPGMKLGLGFIKNSIGRKPKTPAPAEKDAEESPGQSRQDGQ